MVRDLSRKDQINIGQFPKRKVYRCAFSPLIVVPANFSEVVSSIESITLIVVKLRQF